MNPDQALKTVTKAKARVDKAQANLDEAVLIAYDTEGVGIDSILAARQISRSSFYRWLEEVRPSPKPNRRIVPEEFDARLMS
jgi:hypothetical protein